MILSPQILQVGGEQVSIRSDDHLHALPLNRHTVDASATQSLLVNLLAVSDLAAQASRARLDRHHVVDSPNAAKMCSTRFIAHLLEVDTGSCVARRSAPTVCNGLPGTRTGNKRQQDRRHRYDG